MSVTTKIVFDYDTVNVQTYSDGSTILASDGYEIEISKLLLRYIMQQHLAEGFSFSC
jgi:hypothetical protein